MNFATSPDSHSGRPRESKQFHELLEPFPLGVYSVASRTAARLALLSSARSQPLIDLFVGHLRSNRYRAAHAISGVAFVTSYGSSTVVSFKSHTSDYSRLHADCKHFRMLVFNNLENSLCDYRVLGREVLSPYSGHSRFQEVLSVGVCGAYWDFGWLQVGPVGEGAPFTATKKAKSAAERHDALPSRMRNVPIRIAGSRIFRDNINSKPKAMPAIPSRNIGNDWPRIAIASLCIKVILLVPCTKSLHDLNV